MKLTCNNNVQLAPSRVGVERKHDKHEDHAMMDMEVIRRCGYALLKRKLLESYLPTINEEIKIAVDSIVYGGAYSAKMHHIDKNRVSEIRRKIVRLAEENAPIQ